MKASINLKNLALLHSLCRVKTLSRAAEREMMDLSEASRRLSALESEFGFDLLDRSKRPGVVTQAAKRLDAYAGRISKSYVSLLEVVNEIHKDLEKQKSLRTIRISLPVNFDKVGLLAALYSYESKHEGLRLEFSADSGIPALLGEETDISMGGYLWSGKGVFSLPAGKCFNFLMASDAYVRRNGLPEKIGDLLEGKHRLIMRNRNNRFFSNKLTDGVQTVYVGAKADVFYGDAEACREMLISSRGIAVDLSVGYVSEFIAQGTVRPVLPGWHREPWTYYVYCRAAQAEDHVVRELMAFIAKNAFSQISNQWEFWYRQLGLPMPLES